MHCSAQGCWLVCCRAPACNMHCACICAFHRLDTLGEVCLAVDRAADQRAAFIRQRWQAGPARGMALGAAGARQEAAGAAAPGWITCMRLHACLAASSAQQHCSLPALPCCKVTCAYTCCFTAVRTGGARQLSVAAPLSAADTLELQDAHREALALVEALSMRPGLAGLGGGGGSAAGRASAAAAAAVAATLGGRQDRTLKWTQGALAKALEAREAGIRCGCVCFACVCAVCFVRCTSVGDTCTRIRITACMMPLVLAQCRSFVLRLRASRNQLGGGSSLGRAIKTDDVVKASVVEMRRASVVWAACCLAPSWPLPLRSFGSMNRPAHALLHTCLWRLRTHHPAKHTGRAAARVQARSVQPGGAVCAGTAAAAAAARHQARAGACKRSVCEQA